MGVVDRRKGENIGEVIGFLVAHQSEDGNESKAKGKASTGRGGTSAGWTASHS